MGVAFGLASAVLWGTADFFARLASERVGSRSTIFYMQCIGALSMGLTLLLPANLPPWPSDRVLGIAVVLGLFNVAGGAMLYRALEVGTVSLVSPISSTFAAIAAGLAIGIAGERPAPLQLLGLGLCVLGVVGASIPPRGPATARGRRGLLLAGGAAVCWGISFFALRYVVGDLGSFFPVFVSRVTSIVALGSLAVAQRQRLPLPGGAWGWIVGVAVFDSGAFIFYNLGVATHLTSVVSILSSLFSAVTVILAFIFLRERLGRFQWASVAVIFCGVALVSSGR
jgi:drug/metabolite transporter (DMT)-like permease